MKITYFGHACFLLESREGKRILIDPFNEQVGYPVPRVAADLVLVSHEHFDHNHVQAVTGSPRIIRGLREGGREFHSLEIVIHDEDRFGHRRASPS
ncbi:MAG: hypothetical protein C4303_08465 [candidate division GAL15 bacterium]